jgi:DNA ligase-1
LSENLKVFFREGTMPRFMELAEVFEELEKITSHKEIVRKIADFF